jgi:salicylate hydroxylase
MKIDKCFHDNSSTPLHRADMLNVILDACKKSNLIKLAISQKVVTIDDTGAGVTVKTEAGETYQARRLVGCDGLWSSARRSSATASRWFPAIAYRAVLPTSYRRIPPAQDDGLVWREDSLVHYPPAAASCSTLSWCST